MNEDERERQTRPGVVGMFPCIDLADWRRQGLLEPGSIFFLRLPSAYGTAETPQDGVVDVTRERVRLSYLLAPGIEASRVEFDVPLMHVPCHLGGERAYFQCPGCRRRTTALY